jgi:hypothetical protein
MGHGRQWFPGLKIQKWGAPVVRIFRDGTLRHPHPGSVVDSVKTLELVQSQIWKISGDGGGKLGRGFEQLARVGLARIGAEGFGFACFYEAAALHHGDARA